MKAAHRFINLNIRRHYLVGTRSLTTDKDDFIDVVVENGSQFLISTYPFYGLDGKTLNQNLKPNGGAEGANIASGRHNEGTEVDFEFSLYNRIK